MIRRPTFLKPWHFVANVEALLCRFPWNGPVIMETRLPKLIWEQAALPPLMAEAPIVAAHSRSTLFGNVHSIYYVLCI